MHTKTCPICNSSMTNTLSCWHWECEVCLYESADLTSTINNKLSHNHIDEKTRESGLSHLRIRNNSIIVNEIKKYGVENGKLLDVGSAHGWFLSAAREHGFQAEGIEPDVSVYGSTSLHNLPVRQGYFPETLSDNETFDVIIFNDVFEHIKDLNTTLTECRKHLKAGGLLVLNLPTSGGTLYRLSKLLHRIRVQEFFNRLWQTNLPSPHIHYFNRSNLSNLLTQYGYETITSGSLSTISTKGLYKRISCTNKQSRIKNIFTYLAVLIATPILAVTPSDIIYTVSKKVSAE